MLVLLFTSFQIWGRGFFQLTWCYPRSFCVCSCFQTELDLVETITCYHEQFVQKYTQELSAGWEYVCCIVATRWRLKFDESIPWYKHLTARFAHKWLDHFQLASCSPIARLQ